MWLLALLCAFIGVAISVLEGKFLMPSLEWFVLGILFAVLSGAELTVPFRRVR